MTIAWSIWLSAECSWFTSRGAHEMWQSWCHGTSPPSCCLHSYQLWQATKDIWMGANLFLPHVLRRHLSKKSPAKEWALPVSKESLPGTCLPEVKIFLQFAFPPITIRKKKTHPAVMNTERDYIRENFSVFLAYFHSLCNWSQAGTNLM